MRRTIMGTAKVAAAVSAGLAALALAGSASASATDGGTASGPQFQSRVILNGQDLQHSFVPAGSTTPKTESLSSPDDITMLGHHLFVTFQNGVGPQGQPSADGNSDSTIVEFTPSGTVIDQWDLVGKCDGLTADPQLGVVIATINEDANSHIDTIRPTAPAGQQVQVYAYSDSPLPHNGGTDAISIYHGEVLVSASAPGTIGAAAPQPTYPAVYSVTFDAGTGIATVTPLFYDEDPAVNVTVGPNFGTVAPLALTDPDSNEVVPYSAPRFGGDFMLTSQGDQEQIFVQPGYGGSGPGLAVLDLANSVDDTAWATGPGRLFGSSTSTDTVNEITGPFQPGQIYTAVTPCDANDAPATCPGPGFPENYLATLNPWTGALAAVTLSGASFEPQGMIFVGSR